MQYICKVNKAQNKKQNKMKLTNEFIANNKVNGNFQKVVKYTECTNILITTITDKRVNARILGQCSSKGRFNSKNIWFKNDETMTQWYLDNRVIK
jgi:hypothetical protein